MTNQDPIPTKPSALELVPVETLTLFDVNRRTTVLEDHIDTLAASIARFGLLQNLAGLHTKNRKVEIFAGGRRLRALQKIAGEAKTPAPTPVPVPVRIAEEAEEAATRAKAENMARRSLTPADEIHACGAMHAKGASVPDIALAFAVSEASVYQRLALSPPCPPPSSMRLPQVRSPSVPPTPSRFGRRGTDALAPRPDQRPARPRGKVEIGAQGRDRQRQRPPRDLRGLRGLRGRWRHRHPRSVLRDGRFDRFG